MKAIKAPTPDNTSKFQEYLQHLRSVAKNEREKGHLFELAIRGFLRDSPEYDFEDVWLWADYPNLDQHGFSKQDSGIDLVAKEKDTGKLWAIQCKFYQQETPIDRKGIDSFLATSRGDMFSERLIVTTTYDWGKNANDILMRQGKDCRIIDLTTLNHAPYDWFKKKLEKSHYKTPFPHQIEAIAKAKKHFRYNDRGQLIMACGTGKTYTSLQILEKITGDQAYVLFLAPSISLITQTLREYAYQAKDRPRFIVVCSDRKADKDSDGYTVTDVPIAPTTDPQQLTDIMQAVSIRPYPQRTIVLCTYQSLKQVAEAQALGAPEFDLAICDEAHRTTGIEGKAKGGNYFTLINDEDYVRCKKRLYMTATPRLYKPSAKTKAQEEGVELCSMDDHQTYGEEFYRLDFSEAIERKLLSDYKVIIFTINQKYACEKLQGGVGNTNLAIDDAAKLVGCYKALRDQGSENGKGDMLKRAVGFVNSIKSSKDAKDGLADVVDCLDAQEHDGFTCETEHIDGTYNSIERNKLLAWLKEHAGQDERGEEICRILMNSKCLTEGVDVPSLDAILFLQPRKSQVDVVQAVGRVMRKAEGKKYGYVILPVVIPAGSNAAQELDNEQTYKVVWQVLNALRSHDNKFDTHINNLHLNENKSDRIKVVGIGNEEEHQPTTNDVNNHLQHNIEDLNKRVYAKIVERCGDRLYEEKWHKRIKEITDTVSTRIDELVNTNKAIEKKFNEYLHGLQASINKDVDIDDAKQMLAQHLVTKPAFDAIFKGYKFSEHNQVSQAMEKVLDSLDKYGFRNELEDCKVFYEKISKRLERIDNSAGRQEVIKKLYGDFLAKAFPKMAQRLGIVYTPITWVDFILRSVEHLVRKEFGKGLDDKGVHIIDPFVGTGSFLVRLLEIDGLISDKDIKYKYQNEIHANDILLLPYYLATVNLESAFQARYGKILPFKNICLTDTFVSEQEALANNLDANNHFWKNFQSRRRQNSSDINVIMMNPNQSAGQKSENDANKNIINPDLEQRIRDTYTANTKGTGKIKIMDSYIKAIRWASDRLIDNGGVIAFISNSSLIDQRSMQGIRHCLFEEFSSIYVLNLRGNQRTKGEMSRKEGGKIFGASSRTGTAIMLLVKNHQTNSKQAKIYYHDIGDYLDREQKESVGENYQSIANIKWQTIIPDRHGDWLNQRDPIYEKLPTLGDKKEGQGVFDLYSCGVITTRDFWVYNYCEKVLEKNMLGMIGVYNTELQRLANIDLNMKNIDQCVDRNPTKISWSVNLKNYLIQGKSINFNKQKTTLSAYRPFTKRYLYYCKMCNHSRSQTYKILPISNNRWFCVSGVGAKEFSLLMTQLLPDYQLLGNCQSFPLYYLDADNKQRDGISNEAQLKWQKHYQDENITKEAMFYHFYGILHAKDYQEKYQNNLVKGLPRIPFVDDFWHFAKIGRQLADLHVNYEQERSTDGVKVLYRGTETKLEDIPTDALQVIKKMKIAKDFKSIQYNNDIEIIDIPDQAWEHKINGYAPVKWVVERYYRKTDKKTQITDDPNKYSDDPLYILKLVLSTITVGVKTTELVGKLKKVVGCQ